MEKKNKKKNGTINGEWMVRLHGVNDMQWKSERVLQEMEIDDLASSFLQVGMVSVHS